MQIIFSLLCHSAQATRPAAENPACARGGIVRVSGHGLATRRRRGLFHLWRRIRILQCDYRAVLLAADLNSGCDGTLLLLFANST
jgi:hypothetical protein